MTMWMIEYQYDDQSQLRDVHRPDHRAYLASLMEDGRMLAYGRFDDDGAPGAMLLAKAPTADEVETLVSQDPFVLHGLVPSHRVRRWAGVVAPAPDVE